MKEIVGLTAYGKRTEGIQTPHRLLHLDIKCSGELWDAAKKILITGFITIQISVVRYYLIQKIKP